MLTINKYGLDAIEYDKFKLPIAYQRPNLEATNRTRAVILKIAKNK